jgi:hypothetical protein
MRKRTDREHDAVAIDLARPLANLPASPVALLDLVSRAIRVRVVDGLTPHLRLALGTSDDLNSESCS